MILDVPTSIFWSILLKFINRSFSVINSDLLIVSVGIYDQHLLLAYLQIIADVSTGFGR